MKVITLMGFLNENDGCLLMTIMAARSYKRSKSETTIDKKLKIGTRVAFTVIKLLCKLCVNDLKGLKVMTSRI